MQKPPPRELFDSLPTISPEEAMLSDDREMQLRGVASVLTAKEVIERARLHGTTVGSYIDGKYVALDPDSPLLPDIEHLMSLAEKVLRNA